MDLKLFENDIKIKKLYELIFNTNNTINLKTIDMFNKINEYYKSRNDLNKLMQIYKNNKIIIDKYHPSFSSDNISNYINLNRSIQENQTKIIPIIDLLPDYTNIKTINSIDQNSTINNSLNTLPSNNNKLPSNNNNKLPSNNLSSNNEQITQLINENQILQKKLEEIQNQINDIPDKINNILHKTNEIKLNNIYNHEYLNNDIIINEFIPQNPIANNIINTDNTINADNTINTNNNIEIKLTIEQQHNLNTLFKLLFDNQILNYIEINNIKTQLINGIIDYKTVNNYLESKKKYIKLKEINNSKNINKYNYKKENKTMIYNNNYLNFIDRPTIGSVRQNNINYPSITDF